jgi:EAL domain-containing protein (putative c-di-GMP-specific phosphodiesterase class I)
LSSPSTSRRRLPARPTASEARTRAGGRRRRRAGYASLRHPELRPTYAKLDISLVHGIDGDDLRQALAAGLQYFASKTGCRLIAEGVETQAEADVLTGLGIRFGQGDLFGRPELAA